jgi:putative transposase
LSRPAACWRFECAVARGQTKISYAGYRFPAEIIQQAIWLYLRFTVSFRDVEDLLAERWILVSYETVRRWVNHFGPTNRSRLAQTPAPGIWMSLSENRWSYAEKSVTV